LLVNTNADIHCILVKLYRLLDKVVSV
jgi:hypothetical protein